MVSALVPNPYSLDTRGPVLHNPCLRAEQDPSMTPAVAIVYNILMLVDSGSTHMTSAGASLHLAQSLSASREQSAMQLPCYSKHPFPLNTMQCCNALS